MRISCEVRYTFRLEIEAHLSVSNSRSMKKSHTLELAWSALQLQTWNGGALFTIRHEELRYTSMGRYRSNTAIILTLRCFKAENSPNARVVRDDEERTFEADFWPRAYSTRSAIVQDWADGSRRARIATSSEVENPQRSFFAARSRSRFGSLQHRRAVF